MCSDIEEEILKEVYEKTPDVRKAERGK